MQKLLLTVLATAAAVFPATAQAQRAPAAVIVAVDTDRIARDCTACRAATTQIQGQTATLRTRAQTLEQQLQTEGKPIQDAINALNGKAPDAALQARVTAFQTKQQNAQRELAQTERNIQSTQVHVNQQIGARLKTIISSVATARGANVALDAGSTLYSAPAVDVTDAVLAQLNQQLPSVSVTPLPQQQQRSSTQGR
ncbi:MAG TPA: OmpH family outer membrane protein [Sphingomicrobium sp.]|jgi:Skp family chaperone for outer membrane proteins|nr:OmpH family outer membrane protein [Sphingomicrobium sp.]